MTAIKRLKIFTLIFLISVAVVLCAYLIYAYNHYADRVPPGTSLAGEDVSGVTPDEARRAGQGIYDNIVMNLTLSNDSGVTVPAIEKTLTAADIGIAFDAESTAREVLNAASDEWFITRVNPFVEKSVDLIVSVDEEAITQKIGEDFKDAIVETKLPKIKYDKRGKVFVMTPGVVGTTLDTERFIAEVKAGALRAGEYKYDVHLDPIMPRISDAAADEAKARAERAAGAMVGFEKDGEVVYKAGKNSKASWITFTEDEDGGAFVVAVDDEKVMEFLKTTASSKLATKPLTELVVREIDMEAAEKEKAEAEKAAAKEKAAAEKAAAKERAAAEKAEKAAAKEAKKKATEVTEAAKTEAAESETAEAEGKESDKKSDDADAESGGDEAADGGGEASDGGAGAASGDGADAAEVEVKEPAPKAARVVRKGEEGLAIANRAALAAQIETNMLAGKDIKLTPEYEPLPYETEEIGPDFGKWVETDLTRQITYLWNGNKKLKTYVVSTGKNVTPTITGTYQIYMKRDHHDMKGYDKIKEKDYVQPDVRYISYFEGAYAYHAAYWHNAFGTQVSHGCINMKTPEAKYLNEWAPVGTTCIIHY
jgi:hypothetical protein